MPAQANECEVVELLQAMVATPSVNSAVTGDPLAEAGMVKLLEAQAQAWGLVCQRLPIAGRADNLLITVESQSKHPWLLFESHMDTVSVEGMTIDPFAARHENGRIWGRGSCDTKGTGAAMFCALRAYAQLARADQPNNVALLFAIDEEYGMTGIREFVERQMPALSWRAQAAVVGEPTRLLPMVTHNGCIRWRISTHGRAAHASKPAEGDSAISQMMRVIDAIEQYYIPSLTREHPMTGKAQASVNMIRGGTQVNIVPERCEIDMDRRLVPGESAEQAEAELVRCLVEHVSKGVKWELEKRLFVAPPMVLEERAHWAQLVAKSLRAQGLNGEGQGAAYATDGGDLSRAGVPCVVLGPGDIAQAHTKDEYLEITQLQSAVVVYGALMRCELGRV